jgi:hypothetical protein
VTDGVKSVLEAYESLAESEREEVLAELFRRAAERVFLEYDRSESGDCRHLVGVRSDSWT